MTEKEANACPSCGKKLSQAAMAKKKCRKPWGCGHDWSDKVKLKEKSKNETEAAPAQGEVSTGTVSVIITSKAHLLDESLSRNEQIEVDIFRTAHATVSKGFEKILKDSSGYPIGKVSVFISWPCYREELPTVSAAVEKRARTEMRNTIASLTGKPVEPDPDARPVARKTEPTPQPKPKMEGPIAGGGVVLKRKKKEPM